jgi:predicted CXXCH cytochrome family protein
MALCNFCHGTYQQDHTRGLIVFEEQADCMNCHDPHLGAESPARLKAEYFDFLRGTVTINPHYRRVLCSLCHVEEKSFTLITRDTTLLCNRCHASRKIVGSSHPLNQVPTGMELPEDWPVRKGKLACLTCHLPGHQDDPKGGRLLRGGSYDSRAAFCGQCHDPESRGETNPHPLIRELKGCASCHAEIPVFGRDNAQTVTFNASINVTCLGCHDPLPHPGGRSHTIGIDPERAAGIPAYLPLGPLGRITCATCHNPHLAEDEGHKLRETQSEMKICIACHF